METYGGDFTLENMKGRPVFIRELGMIDLYCSCVCDECGELATCTIYELDGESWYWCGECDQG